MGQTTARSMLEFYLSGVAGPDRPMVLALHGAGADHWQLLPLLAAAAPDCMVVAPKSGRWSGWSAAGQRYSWFQAAEIPVIEPIGFGDALWQLEQFIWQMVGGDAQMGFPARRQACVGFDQGAVLASCWHRSGRNCSAVWLH
ncbi:hypothetical protein AWV79_37000 [Cupriavidus sp. UYMMa02A]|nr:hypothetical protein AWV79_37000 [Cupriavidus sp. UYMMa02A]